MKKGFLCVMAAAIMTVSSVPVLAADTDFVVSDDTKLDNGEEIGDEDKSDRPSRPSSSSSSSIGGSSSSTSTTKPSDTDTTPETGVTVNPFKDISASMWCYDYVLDVYNKKLILGTSEDEFSPNTPLTRAMVASIIYRMAGSPDVSYSAIFTDVPDGQWYTKGIIWAYNNKVISGYGNGLCGPNDYVTVEQLASILYRYAGSPEVTAEITGYSDVAAISEYAKTGMAWAVSKKMNNGETLHPASPATRAEAAKMFSLF